ncbi:MAG: AAA domain-containing protein [Mycoplasma sp.]|nr:AAA domain-containing protein [Mycoplasma sp.]
MDFSIISTILTSSILGIPIFLIVLGFISFFCDFGIDWLDDIWENFLDYWLIWIGCILLLTGLTFTILGSISLSNPTLNLNTAAELCFVILGPIFICISLVLFFIYIKWFNPDYVYAFEDDNHDIKTKELDQNKTMTKKVHKKNTFSLTKDKLNVFDDHFNNKVIGQKLAQDKIKSQLVQLMYMLDDKSNRPAGIFFFVGPTGVGKTEMAKTLNSFLYENKDINRFDMSEYKSEMATQQLLGAPNGYVGYDEGGTLIKAMKKNPDSIVLFDEIEKGDKSVYDLFLQILDEGMVTSNKGEKISFKNSFIIFTSNIGANRVRENMSKDEVNRVISKSIDDFFVNELNRPEILGRIGKDNIIPFNMIKDKEDLFLILDIHFKEFTNQLNKRKVKVKFDKDSLYNSILLGIDKTKGARDIRNEFDVFKKAFMLSLFENNLDFDKLQNKTINFEYKNKNVNINVI